MLENTYARAKQALGVPAASTKGLPFVRRYRRMRRALIWAVPLALILFGFCLLAAARRSTAFAEWYAGTVYARLSRLVGGVTGLAPFSLGEVLVVALVLLGVGWLGTLAVLLVHKRRVPRRFLKRSGIVLLWGAGLLFFLFALNCGVNYHRLPFSAYSGLAVRDSSPQELAALCEELIKETNALAGGTAASPAGETALGRDVRAAARQAAAVMDALAAKYPVLGGHYPPAKPVTLSRGLSYLDLTGIYFPPTVEANFNADVPAYHIPATICHELSHLSGFMREDEANFIAYLACRDSGDAIFHYSGNMLALVHSMNALYAADYALFEQLYARYGARISADFSANYYYWKQFEGPVAQVSEFANDTYLKVNAQPDGVKSYGRMVDLLLADYRARHGLQ